MKRRTFFSTILGAFVAGNLKPKKPQRIRNITVKLRGKVFGPFEPIYPFRIMTWPEYLRGIQADGNSIRQT